MTKQQCTPFDAPGASSRSSQSAASVDERSLNLMRYGIADSVAQLDGIPLVPRRTHQFDNPKALTVKDRIHGYESGDSFRQAGRVSQRAAHRTNKSWIVK